MDAGLRVLSYYLGEHMQLMGLSRKIEHLKKLHTLLEFMRSRGQTITQEHGDIHRPQ